MRYTFTSHKKYNDSGTHEPFDMFKGTAAAGLDDCHKETEAFAKEQKHLICKHPVKPCRSRKTDSGRACMEPLGRYPSSYPLINNI